MRKAAWGGLFVVVLAGALLLRTRDLALRPMHHDEANQALKFGALLETGAYAYDKDDHHGPSLYYLTLPVARAAGRRLTASLDESVLRLVPALFGLGCLLLVLLLADGLGRDGALLAALFAAVSPIAVYYARFYIQETILVFFIAALLASLWRYARKPSFGWAAAAGLSAGMMYATKETSVIAFAALAAALPFLRKGSPRGSGAAEGPESGRKVAHALAGLAVALVAAGLLFSSFFRNPGGLWDSLLSFRTYWSRGADAGWHTRSPFYYLGLLSYARPGAGGPAWSEAFILLLAVVGGIFALRKERIGERPRPLAKGLLAYTGISLLAYSLIPYKTPWNALPFYLGVTLLAGFGAARALAAFSKAGARAAVAALLLAGTFHLWVQCRKANFELPADPRNPYAYAQTGPDLLRLVRRIDALAALRPEGRRMFIKVVAGPYDTWPLPWYLRGYTNVGYWTEAASAGVIGDAPVVVASADESAKVAAALGDGFRSEFYGLRPEVLLTLWVRNDLWDRLVAGRAGP